ncbi:hypothetical protein [Spartinivicinus poritis]|uniref:Uncharacterized protein n=1 Tax=Spartinivicinus poritis TaxID=2994640 RepID=A0ABT5U7W9_9GAMM|nr:hypothetical protein [Spartinivicinus sp. A2-2]MDE1462460.1 hypothetical protein [Spartinivicinus sp. A2-2]
MSLSDQDFIEQFEQLTLPAEYFNHVGHLRLAWLYLQQYELTDAINKTTTGIQAYANHLGAKDKFHHTITEALIHIIYHRTITIIDSSFSDFLLVNQDLVNNAKDVLCQYYSASVLFSTEAKKLFVEPDRLAFSNKQSAIS